MIKKILLLLVLLIAGFCVAVILQPSEFTITRTAKVAAAPAVVFSHVNDFHKWQAWSPWAKIDPEAEIAYDGAESGKGAVFSWSGNAEVGEGRQTIAESRAAKQIRIDMEFIRPFAAESEVQFDFEPAGEATEVTWTMTGENNFIGKAMHLCFDCDKMVGGQFEEGLANLNQVVTSEDSP